MNTIKSQRLARAWSQEQLAELSALSVRTIQRIENGERASLETLSAIAAAFGVNVTTLMPEDSEQAASGDSLALRISQARTQVEQESRFWRSLLLFVPVNIVLVVINLWVNPHTYWFIWPLLAWGGALLVRATRIFWLRDRWSRWEQERLQKMLRKP
ncbi:2TM domain-containing protein [Dickeya zeae]|uniref:2TM domain-containing protein n=1 Tax=Dickeya zeae TaxID=204042 RepID=UPI0003812426|nr:2TM domain-containing protein [Dickeya zeae]PXW43867.1 helix-turn-helix protein [Erwinia sp. AG740]UJR56210.1 Pr2TM family membrane protein [Dickeya zeae MS1]UJR63899.1 Pr2TM family membrane protein [Dickeya zeae]